MPTSKLDVDLERLASFAELVISMVPDPYIIRAHHRGLVMFTMHRPMMVPTSRSIIVDDSRALPGTMHHPLDHPLPMISVDDCRFVITTMK